MIAAAAFRFDLDDIWREHKKFILAAGGGLVGFLALLVVAGMIRGDSDKKTRENQVRERRIQDAIDELGDREAYEAGVERTLKDVVRQARAQLELVPRPEFELKPGEADPYLAYHRVLERVEAAAAEADRRNIPRPQDLGFVKQPPSEERVPEHLVSLDLGERVLKAAIEAGVTKIDAFRPREAEYERPVEAEAGDAGTEEPGTGTSAGTGTDGGDGGPLVLRRVALDVAVTGPLDAIVTLLAELSRSGRFLEVAALEMLRASDGLVRAELTLGGLTLVTEAEATAAGAAKGSREEGGGRRRLVRPGERRR